MSDKDKLKDLLKEFGVGFKEEEDAIVLETGDTKVDGYAGAMAFFTFDADNKFTGIEMGEA